jgi:hypothetical protein
MKTIHLWAKSMWKKGLKAFTLAVFETDFVDRVRQFPE